MEKKRTWRPKDWNHKLLLNLARQESQDNFNHDASFEAGADAMIRALEPLIRRIAPSSKLVDIIYGDKNES